MKIIFGTLPSLYSLYFANYCLRELNLRFSSILLSNRPVTVDGIELSTLGDVSFLFRRFGWRYSAFLLSNIITMWLSKALRILLPDHKRLWSFTELSERFGIELIQHKDFNDDGVTRLIDAQKPDVLLINGCNQILKQPLISVPFKYCLNLHPSLLPSDRGVDPVFQKLLRGEKTIDTTLHKLTEVIDAGPIYRQNSEPYSDDKNYLELMMCQARQGAVVFQRFLVDTCPPRPQGTDTDYPYRSWPSRQEIRCFDDQGKRWLSFSSLGKILTFSHTESS